MLIGLRSVMGVVGLWILGVMWVMVLLSVMSLVRVEDVYSLQCFYEDWHPSKGLTMRE